MMSLITALLFLLISNGCSGCGEGCVSCAGISKICTGCKNGYWLLNNDCRRCHDNCEQCPDSTRCSKCKTNFWGTGTCDKQCPESCDESGCDDKTGQCYNCQPGFYGTSCLQNCTLCKNSLCDNDQCINGCTDGYFEDTASTEKKCLKCSDNCSSCQSQAICLECDKGFYKLAFESSAGYHVTICSPCLSVCEECNIANNCTLCKSGKYGSLCQHNCSDPHCHRCVQYQYIQVCTKCNTGYEVYGTTCGPERVCSQNCVDGCNERNLACKGGCQDGWSGKTCTKQCASQCQKCDQNNDTICTECKGDFFTSSCNDPCNVHCSKQPFMVTCSLDDGFCINGCTDGYWGVSCNKSCYKGCNSTRCNQTNGFCDTCHRKYYGEACEQICSDHCVDDDRRLQICRKSDGICELGCNNGYSGDKCDEITSRRMTTFPTSVTQETGPQCIKLDTNCNESQFYLLGIVTGVGISLLVAGGIRVFVCLRRRKNIISESNNSLENSEQREYENTAVGMRSMPSIEADYPNYNQGHDQTSAEASLDVYEGLQNDKRDDQQQYSELGRPTEKV